MTILKNNWKIIKNDAMKKLIISLSLICLTITIFSQELRKGLIGISIGPSIPVSDYADNDSENSHAGFALTGLNLNLNFNYRFNENIGVAALMTKNTHPIDEDEMVKLFGTYDPSLNVDLETGAWSSASLMGGLLISFPFTKVDVDFRALIGYSLSTVPKLDVTTSYENISVNIKQSEASSMAFALNIGAGFRYHLSDKFALTFNVDYFSTEPQFEVETSILESSFSNTVKQKMNMMNISFGIGYMLK